jgi:hypothetical protein
METISITLFLDFDGVLNNDNFLRHQKNHVRPAAHNLFDPTNIASLNKLCCELQIAKIVISSTWRKDRSLSEIQSLLSREGFVFAERILDVTPVLGLQCETRADEIKEWISKHKPEAVLVLDDFDLAASIVKGFFRVNSAEGLTDKLVASIISSFN